MPGASGEAKGSQRPCVSAVAGEPASPRGHALAATCVCGAVLALLGPLLPTVSG